MKRRQFITGLGGAALGGLTVWPFAANAQPKTIRRVGFLGGSILTTPTSDNYKAFLAQLDEAGLRPGRNIIVEYKGLSDPRGPGGSAGDLLRSKPEVIVVTGPEVALQAIQAQDKTVPVVFFTTQYDPVALKLIASPENPGGNVTGVFLRAPDLAAKQIALLTEALPGRKRVAVAWDMETADHFTAIERAGKAAGLEIIGIRHEKPPYSIELTFKNFVVRKVQAAMFLPSPHFGGRRSKIAELATARKLPTLLGSKAYVESGGLMSLGIDYPVAMRKVGDLTAKIMRGEKAAKLPADAAPKLELAVNTKTAKAIGIELPEAVIKRADKVVDQ